MIISHELDIYRISPENHPGFGPNSIFTRIHTGHIPSAMPLFHRHSNIEPRAPMASDIATHLIEFNKNIGNTLVPDVQSRLQKSAQLVIAGQQPGLLLGPLYTFWKLLTA
ncbi:bacillithiol biosynthesis BshC, partial [bacterium]|nr:bacillithiol biosynthesis BshC [bacterium]